MTRDIMKTGQRRLRNGDDENKEIDELDNDYNTPPEIIPTKLFFTVKGAPREDISRKNGVTPAPGFHAFTTPGFKLREE